MNLPMPLTAPRALALLALWLAVATPWLPARAQTPTAEPAAPAASAAAAPASAPEAAAAASAPTLPPPVVLDCTAATNQANTADLKAVTAQAQKAGLKQLADLFDDSADKWQKTVDACQGRARERALRNLADAKKVRAGITDLQGSGEQCEGTQKDASALQDLARQAMSERRWPDATVLFRKAEDMWDLASERCTGAPQQQATQKRDQSTVDAHNAEFCAPPFDRAREFNQKFRAAITGLSAAEKQQQSQMAETLWREAVKQCKGAALDLARNNAQNLANERGTPWVASLPPGVTAVPAPVKAAAKPAAATGAAAATATAAAGLASVAAAAPKPVAPATASALPASLPLAEPAPAPAAAPEFKQIDVTLAGNTRFTGLFQQDPATRRYTGNGSISWANGDVYEGEVLQGLRHGQGEFRWPSGQRYKGPWVQDQAQGKGTLRFANGNLYEGTVDDGVPQGKGVMIYAGGEIFEGQFVAGVPDGRGVYNWPNGQRYEGPWVKGLATGKGKLRFANGNVYEGPVAEGSPHGDGVLKFANGDQYQGHFDKGLLDGQGRFTWKGGDSYSGAWKAGLKEGQGVMQWANGDRWEGIYKADAQTAEGQLIRKAK